MIARRLLTSIALFLSGCAGAQQGYPSLAKRAVEGAPIAEVAPPPAPVAADAALKARVEKLSAQAQAGRAAFDRAYPAADRAAQAARGAPVSSDAWVSAQIAISGLETARNDSVSALASLDTLYVERSNAIAEGKEQGGAEEVDAARAAALSIVDGQNDRLDALKGRLAQP
ncbi:hypothetical protein [Sphingobium cloacae]|uniref:Lipoprotein n=1 Tax=Sphingobium cloacae TaxID=120107 RepID=A0A1E1F1H5_9SPHN|nr:hypothetical protein [Sphingobium cloacae]BAV64375.1 hypothetical protein SCLO_1013350 [Sphingobium cloacae]